MQDARATLGAIGDAQFPMPSLETQALLLETREYRESSVLLTLLTPERGRVGAVAKGVHRKNSPLQSALQPFSLLHVRLSMRSTSGLATLTGADLLERPDYIQPGGGHDAIARLAYAGVLAEVLTLGHENEPGSEEVFTLARDFFLGLAAAPHPGSFALRGFVTLLRMMGYAIELPSAATQGAGPYRFSLKEGVLRPPGSGSKLGDLPLSAEAVEALRRLTAPAAGHWGAEPPAVGRRVGPVVARLVIRMFETHLEHTLRSARFLEEMVLSAT